VLAYEFPLLGAFLSMLFFFLWVVWLLILFRTVMDIFRSDDLSGVAKAGWLLFVIVLPYLGVFVYLISRGDKMTQRDVADMQAREAHFAGYVRSVAGGGVSEELTRLAELKERGVLTEDEFAQQKAKLLA
jgi:hypothetical protein